jgi:hypothetical protein
MATAEERLELWGSPPVLGETIRYTFTLARDPTAKRFELSIPSFQYNEFDDYGHATRPEQEQWVTSLLCELKVRWQLLGGGLWALGGEADLDRVRAELVSRLRPARGEG